MGQEKIDAAEVFNWDYLVTIGAYMDKPEISTLDDVVRVFAYAFTSTANPEEQNRLLSEWLRDATYGQSRETAEEILVALAKRTQADLGRLRAFAKQSGVRLRRY